MTDTVPVLQIRRTEEGDEIFVVVSLPNGQTHEVTGFKNETEANEWIAQRFHGWLEEHSRPV
jgi:hypothetical protein